MQIHKFIDKLSRSREWGLSGTADRGEDETDVQQIRHRSHRPMPCHSNRILAITLPTHPISDNCLQFWASPVHSYIIGSAGSSAVLSIEGHSRRYRTATGTLVTQIMKLLIEFCPLCVPLSSSTAI